MSFINKYNGESPRQFYDVLKTNNSIYSVGYGSQQRGLVLKTDLAGNVIWEKNFPDTFFIEKIIKSNNDDVLVIANLSDGYYAILRIDILGEVVWSKKFSIQDNSNESQAPEIVKLLGDEYVILVRRRFINQQNDSNFNDSANHLIKINGLGNILVKRKLIGFRFSVSWMEAIENDVAICIDSIIENSEIRNYNCIVFDSNLNLKLKFKINNSSIWKVIYKNNKLIIFYNLTFTGISLSIIDVPILPIISSSYNSVTLPINVSSINNLTANDDYIFCSFYDQNSNNYPNKIGKFNFNLDLLECKWLLIESSFWITKAFFECFVFSTARNIPCIGFLGNDLQSCKTSNTQNINIQNGQINLIQSNFDITTAVSEFSVTNFSLFFSNFTPEVELLCPITTCIKNEEICKLYADILAIFNNCLINPASIGANYNFSDIIVCLQQIINLIKDFHKIYPQYDLLNVLNSQIVLLETFIKDVKAISYTTVYSAIQSILTQISLIGNCNCESENPPCKKDEILCELYAKLLEIFKKCLLDPKGFTASTKFDAQVICEKEFLNLVLQFHELHPNYNLLTVLNTQINAIKIFIENPNLETYTASWNSIQSILAFLFKLGDCDCGAQLIVPLFAQVGPFCAGKSQDPFPALLTSTNGIVGTWATAYDVNTTKTYTFTPAAGQNASVVTMTVVINPIITATFTQVGPVVLGTVLDPLPFISLEGISGFWSPELDNTQTTTYTFEPAKNTQQCVAGTTMTVVVLPKVVPLVLTDYQSIQSGSLYLQAAGSLGNDSTKGIHLRWTLKGGLAFHLPKANYSENNFNFNKKDDFVRIYRTPYVAKKVILYFDAPISQIVDTPSSKKWVYNVEGKVFHVHFRNTAKYNAVKTQIDPLLSPYEFIQNYGNALIEIENKTELSFAITANFTPVTSANTIRLELLSVEENKISAPKGASLRMNYSVSEINATKLVSENIRSIRFASENSFINEVAFEFYSDFILSNYDAQKWTYVNEFALEKESETDSIVFKRLEPVPNCLNNWLRYNDGVTVNITNYKTKWNTATEVENRIAEVVEAYISKSEFADNPMALETVNTNDIVDIDSCIAANPEDYNPVIEDTPDNSFEISNLHLLQMGSLDYHVARMLGLGHLEIDSIVFDGQYVYLAEYVSFGDLNDGLGAREVQHIYCSLPTGLNDQRLPLPVELEEVRKGIFYNPDIDPNDPEPAVNEPLTDDNGLSHDGKTQFYTLFAKELAEEALNANFFYQNSLFVSSDLTLPVYAGLEYRNVTEIPDWRKPELSFDSLYYNPDGVTNETKPILLPEAGKPIYIHRERTSGDYNYTSYGVNWFSRASALAPIKRVETRIKPKNLLQPPTNVAAALIQKENPLLLTTGVEQGLLNALTTEDKTLVRLTFEYNHGQELIDYHKKINNEIIKDYRELNDLDEFFAEDILINFRNEIPNTISGKIESVTAGVNDVLLIVQTSIYPIISSGIKTQNPLKYNEEIIPVVPQGMNTHFIGSIMLVDDVEYVIHEIDTSGAYPKFTIFKSDLSGALVDMTTVVNPSIPLSVPVAGKLFVVVENMQQAVSWKMPNPSNFKIKIEPTDIFREEGIVIESTDCTNNTYVQKFRGVYKDALIEKLKEKIYTDDGDDIPENSPFEEWHLGLYRVTLPGYKMPQHSQFRANSENSVAFYNGVVRLHTWNGTSIGSGPRKNFKVVRTENIGINEDLVLYIEDLTFPKNTTDSDYSAILEAYTGKLMATLTESNNQFVNYYPGYKVYLYKDISIGLDEDNVLPIDDEDVRYSIFGLQSHKNDILSTEISEDKSSPYSIPAFMFAQNIKEPLQPDGPTGGLYATRPDFFGKSTYTFETTYKQKPHSVQFNRASDVQFISALYDNSVLGYDEVTKLPILNTVQTILETIFMNGEEDFYVDRWNNLLGFDYDYMGLVPNNSSFDDDFGYFRFFEGRRLPMPNNKNFIEGINHFIDSHNEFYFNSPEPILNLNVIVENEIITSVTFGSPAILLTLETEIIPQVSNPDGTLRNGQLLYKDFIKDALHNCFVPLTEVPVIYNYIKTDPLHKPIPKKQVVRDRNGQLLKPSDIEFDMAPMAVRYNGVNKTKFTDFGLDGASNARYFYAVREINLQMKTGPYSDVVGPITLVNTAPPTAPEILKIIPVLENRTLGVKPSIQLEINSYPEAQNIRKINIYRSDNATDALSIRTMKLVRVVNLETEDLTNDSKWVFTDDFSDLPELAFTDLQQVPFSDLLYYKLTVSRVIKYNEIGNINSVEDFTPSEASKLVVTNIVENYSPESPVVKYASQPINTSGRLRYVTLFWDENVYKGNYHLFKMNSQGNWVEVARIIADRLTKGLYHVFNTNGTTAGVLVDWHEATTLNTLDGKLYLPLELTNLNSSSIETKAADGSTIYHHFKVIAENTAGMFSSKEHILSIYNLISWNDIGGIATPDHMQGMIIGPTFIVGADGLGRLSIENPITGGDILEID